MRCGSGDGRGTINPGLIPESYPVFLAFPTASPGFFAHLGIGIARGRGPEPVRSMVRSYQLPPPTDVVTGLDRDVMASQSKKVDVGGVTLQLSTPDTSE